jgi:hypothetical protein
VGSSTRYPSPAGYEVTPADAVTIVVDASAAHGDGPCAADLSPTTTVIGLPDAATLSSEVTIREVADRFDAVTIPILQGVVD